MGDFQKDPSLEVVYEDGRPSYFREVARECPLTYVVTASNQKVNKSW